MSESRKYQVKPKTQLTDEQTQYAMDEMNVRYFPREEKYSIDPVYNGQKYCLHTFIPSKGATPDKDGVYGMIKFRGAFQSEDEMNERAEFLIRYVDSFHTVYHGYMGRYFPATVSSKYSEEVNEIDIKKKSIEVVSDSVKEAKLKERKEIEEIKEREKKLVAEVESDPDPQEQYTCMRVKRAQLLYTITETLAKIEDMKKTCRETDDKIKQIDEASPHFKEQYLEKYMEARRNAGIPETDDSLIKYMGDDFSVDEL